MQPSFDYSAVDDILSLYGKKESNIIAILQDVQEHYRYLPRDVFPYLSGALGVSEATQRHDAGALTDQDAVGGLGEGTDPAARREGCGLHRLME